MFCLRSVLLCILQRITTNESPIANICSKYCDGLDNDGHVDNGCSQNRCYDVNTLSTLFPFLLFNSSVLHSIQSSSLVYLIKHTHVEKHTCRYNKRTVIRTDLPSFFFRDACKYSVIQKILTSHSSVIAH